MDFKLLLLPFCGHKPDMCNLIDRLHQTGIYTHWIDKDIPDVGVHYTHNPKDADSEESGQYHDV